MRILLVNHFPLEGSGSGIYTRDLAQELTHLGHEVSVIFPEHERIGAMGFRTHEILFSNGRNEEVDLPFNFPCFTSHPRSNLTYYELDESQIEAYIEKFEEAVSEEIAGFKPDLIHAQHLWITPYVAARSGLPYVATVHGTDLKGFVRDKRYHPYALEGARKALKVITISKEVDQETKQLYGLPDEQCRMVFNGYNARLFHRQEVDRQALLGSLGIYQPAEHLVTFAGKLTHFKGVDVLLKAAKIYERRLSGNVVTVIAGNGELYGELERLRSRLELDHVHLIGHLPQPELARLYNVSDVHVVPSRNEPFGLVAIEAMACGATVIGTDQGGLRDIIQPEIGERVRVDDDLGLAQAVIDELLLRKSETRREAVSRYVREYFSLEKAVSQVVEIYESII